MNTTTTTALSDRTREAIAAMHRDTGRHVTIKGSTVWVCTRKDMTVNCTDDPDHGPSATPCTGWIAPTLGVAPCWCPCHDEHRPPYADAVAQVEARLATPGDRR